MRRREKPNIPTKNSRKKKLKKVRGKKNLGRTTKAKKQVADRKRGCEWQFSSSAPKSRELLIKKKKEYGKKRRKKLIKGGKDEEKGKGRADEDV